MEGEAPISERFWIRIPLYIRTMLLVLFNKLTNRIAALEAEVAALKAAFEKLNQNSTNSSYPSSKDKPDVKRARPRKKGVRNKGAQKGHQKHDRPLVPPEKVNQTVPCKPTNCECCGDPIEGEDPDYEPFQVAEIPPVEPHVTEYPLHSLPCESCGHSSKGRLPDGIGPGHFGPRLVCVLSLLTGMCRLSKRSIKRLLSEVFGLAISTGQICRLQSKMADALDPCVEEAKAYVRTKPTNIDETTWKEKRKTVRLWVAATPWVVLFLIRPTRGAIVLKEIIGPDYEYVVTSDRAKAYETLPAKLRQLCWAHLDRDFQAMVDRNNRGSPVGKRLMNQVDELFAKWGKVRDGTWSRATFYRHTASLRADFLAGFEFGRKCGCAKTAATCRKLLKWKDSLWTFAKVEGVEPTNNGGEREIRHPVEYRKMCFGTDSEQGSKFVGNIMTVTATLRRQGRDVLEFLVACYTAYINGVEPPSLLPSADATDRDG